MQALRFDRSTIAPAQVTGAGALRVPASIARTGVQMYSDGANSWGELRPESEVFSPASTESVRAVPVTVGHEGEIISPESWQQHSHGHAGDVTSRDGSWLVVDLVISHAPTIKRVKARELTEISAGYRCDLEHKPGVHNGQPYKLIQRNIRYNHATLLPPNTARAGSGARVRLDSRTSLPFAIGVPMFKKLPYLEIDAAKATARFDGKNFELNKPADVEALRGAQLGSLSAIRVDMVDEADLKPMLEQLQAGAIANAEIIAQLMGLLQVASEEMAEAVEPPTDLAEMEALVGADVMDAVTSERADLISKAQHFKVDAKGKTTPVITREILVAAGTIKADSKFTDSQLPLILRGLGTSTFSRQDRATIDSGAPSNRTDSATARKEKRKKMAAWAKPALVK